MPGVERPVESVAELQAALDALGTRTGRALILIGGADATETDRFAAIRSLFLVFAAYLARTGTALIDGGTDSGVMRLIAEARHRSNGTFPLIGVAPAGALLRTTRTGAPITAASDHDLIVLVPGSRFGDETSWLFAAADYLADTAAPTLLVNGGQLAGDEARQRLDAGHVVIAVAGSGRAADELAQDPGLRASRTLRVIPLDVDAAGIAAAIEGGARGSGR